MIYNPINPVALDLGIVKIHWYGIMYLLAFLSAYLLAKTRCKKKGIDNKFIEDIIFYGAMGVIIGGRVGYMLFYNFTTFINEPLSLFYLQQGGMSFHGGLIGVIIAMLLFSKKYNKTFFQIMDFVAPLVPIGLGFGRIGNFINSELWGKVTNSQFGIGVYDATNKLIIRYPSQLYEALLEGLLLFMILWVFSAKSRPTKAISALFLIFYGIFRFMIEFVRSPDAHIGYLAFNWFTMGQLLSIPMIVYGIYLLFSAYKK